MKHRVQWVPRRHAPRAAPSVWADFDRAEDADRMAEHLRGKGRQFVIVFRVAGVAA